jgi:hypothetical protein
MNTAKALIEHLCKQEIEPAIEEVIEMTQEYLRSFSHLNSNRLSDVPEVLRSVIYASLATEYHDPEAEALRDWQQRYHNLCAEGNVVFTRYRESRCRFKNLSEYSRRRL